MVARTPLTPAVRGPAQAADVDIGRLRRERLERVRAELQARECAGCVLFDPVNVRYATDSRNMAVWTLHNPARYAFVATEGPVVVFDFHNCAHLSDGLETVDEVRPARGWSFYLAGPRVAERAGEWAAEIADLVHAHGGGARRLAVDRCDPAGAAALAGEDIEVVDGAPPLELARAIKTPAEVACMRAAIAVAEAGMAAMREALAPGLTENELWSLLHQANVALGGEWIETRLLSAGPRTNPWFQECGDHRIEAGDLVAFDTDLIGPFGYCADVSRTYFCGPGRPSDEQRRLYRLAVEQIEANLRLIAPGVGSAELAEKAWRVPGACRPNRYSVIGHGVGMRDEYPRFQYAEERARAGYDAELRPGMTLCLESYIGEVGGREGVKLEEQVLVTEGGCELLSSFPYDEDLLGRQA